MDRIAAVITGIGPVSAIGCGRNEFWDALTSGQHGFGPITLCDTSESPSKIGAELKDFRLEKYVQNGKIMARRTPRPVQIALASSVLALHDAEIDLDACDPNRLGIHVGTSIGNLGDMFLLNAKWQTKGQVPPHTAFYAFSHSAACVLSSFFNVRGPVHTTTSGCNSGIDALGHSLHAIQSGTVDAMLVVGTDCELFPEMLAVLNASNSLSTKYNDDPGKASRPYDLGRDGNVIGEGAAAILLEAEPHAVARDARIYGRMAGYQVCSAGQNRQYSPDNPEIDLRPCVRALQGAIADADWQIDQIDLINANGSSSVIYDRIEAMALAKTFGERFPEIRVHSTKSMLGQHGAGSSALQIVTACLSLRRGIVPPTINYEEPDPQCGDIRVVTEAEECWPERILVHSIGLGGFYYSAATLAVVKRESSMLTGFHQVKWSDDKHPRFQPSDEFQKPLEPWAPRREELLS